VTTRPHGRRPAGFTLIELLVVVGIMATLAALAVGTYFRLQAGQVTKNTESRLAQINVALNQIWSATLDQAKKEFAAKNLPNNQSYDLLVAMCGGDVERARSVYLYLRVKHEFPQNFFEAANDTVLFDSSGNARITLKAKVTLKKNSVIGGTTSAPATLQDAANQSAALLYLIVTEKSVSGAEYGDLVTGANARDLSISGTTFRTFKDGWGSPIIYVRFATNTEINSAPFTRNLTSTVISQDPLDPRGKLSTTWPSPTTPPTPVSPTLPTSSQAGAAASSIFLGTASGLSGFPAASSANWIVTAISAGANKDDPFATGTPRGPYDSVDLTSAGLSSSGLVTVADNTDDILGYRLRREGKRGD